jgi:predicted XRE-type DNA-binding protein
MRARSELMMAMQGWVKASGKTQAEAARLFGITQPRMSDLMRGKISLFWLEALMDMATVAGLEPHITIKKPKATRKRRDEELAAG